MARYLVLIYGDEQVWADAPDQWHRDNDERHRVFVKAAGDAVITGGGLEPSSDATSVRAGTEGRPRVTDGPFLETKEAVGGFYLLEAADLDEAIRLAGQVPEASDAVGGVEVRAIAGG